MHPDEQIKTINIFINHAINVIIWKETLVHAKDVFYWGSKYNIIYVIWSESTLAKASALSVYILYDYVLMENKILKFLIIIVTIDSYNMLVKNVLA